MSEPNGDKVVSVHDLDVAEEVSIAGAEAPLKDLDAPEETKEKRKKAPREKKKEIVHGGGAAGAKKKEVKKESGLGLTFKKEENFGDWYSDVRQTFQPSMWMMFL
jgi:hypothetical protein